MSQKPSNTQQKRRQEVEQKQLEKARVFREEEERNRLRNLERLGEKRRREQGRFEEQSVGFSLLEALQAHVLTKSR